MEGENGQRPVITPEKPKVPEARDTREQVLSAFNESFNLLQNAPPDKLTEQDKSTIETVKAAKEKTIGQGKDWYINEFSNEDTGEKFRTLERVRVDGIVDFLTREIDSGTLTDEDAERYKERRSILVRNSRKYYRNSKRRSPNQKLARTRQEAQEVHDDPLRRTNTPEDDWYKAEDELMRRRELIIPRDKENDKTAEEVASEEEVNPEEAGGSDYIAENDPPQPAPTEQISYNVAIGRRDIDISKQAAMLTEQLIRKEMIRGSLLNPLNWARKIGLRVTEEYWRQKIQTQLRNTMKANNNSYLDLNLSRSSIGALDLVRKEIKNLAIDTEAKRAKSQEAGKATIEQIKEGLLIEGEKAEAAQGQLKDMMINEVLRPIIDGSITEEAQVQQKLREFVEAHQDDPQVKAIFGREATEYGKLADYFASDLLETGQQIKQDLSAHKFASDQLGEVVRIQLANTSWAAETQAHFSATDKAVAWAERHRVTGVLINPATIGAAFSLGTFGALRVTGAAATAAQVLVPGAGTLAGATFAAARRNYDLKVDRAAHQVERAYNMRIPQGARRREALEKHAYNTASVSQLLNGGGRELIGGEERESLEALRAQDLSDGQTTNREAVARRITEIKTRLDHSRLNKVDLITYQSQQEVEQGRLQLLKAIVQARNSLRSSGMSNDEITELENRFTGDWGQKFTENRQQQDKSFAHYRLMESGKAAVFGGVAGLAGGLIAQEGIAIGGRLAGINVAPTWLEKGASAVKNLYEQRPAVQAPSPQAGLVSQPEVRQVFASQAGEIQIGENFRTVTNSDNTVIIIDSQGNRINTPRIFREQNGHLVLKGRLDDLPNEVRTIVENWNPTKTLSYSVKDQLLQLAHTTNSQEVIQLESGFKLEVQEASINVRSPNNDIIANGIINKDTGTLSLQGANREDLQNITDALKKQQFDVTDVKETPASSGKSFKETVSELISSIPPGQEQTRTIYINEGDIKIGRATADGSHVVTFSDKATGLTVTGNVTNDGVFTLFSTKNPNIDFTQLRSLQDRLEKGGFKVDVFHQDGTEEVVKNPILGTNGEWEKNDTEITKREWYSYDRPGSQGNELRLHTLKQGNKIILDMSSMQLGYQRGLNPNPIDVQQVIREGQGAFAFSLPDNQGQPIVVLDSADGVIDGKLTLDPNDETHKINIHNQQSMTLGQFSRIVLNQQAYQNLADGDIATEVHSREKVFNLGKEGKMGFIEAGRVVEGKDGKNTLQAFATIRGAESLPEAIETKIQKPPVDTLTVTPSDVKPPPEIRYDLTAEPPVATDLTPPVTEQPPPPETLPPPLPEASKPEEEAPIFPIPFAPRHPLEPLAKIDYEIERFRRTDTLADLIRFGKPKEREQTERPDIRTAGKYPQIDKIERDESSNKEEGERALELIHNTFIGSPHIYITLSGAIGDVVLTTAYIEGIRRYAERFGGNKKISLVAPPNVHPILEAMAKDHGYEVIGANRHECVRRAHELINGQNEKNSVVFDFDFTLENGPNPILEEMDDGNITIHELLSTAVGLYKNDRSGTDRFSVYLADLLNVPEEQQVKVMPNLVLSENATDIWDELSNKYKIDESKKQIGVVIEGSAAYKRYGLKNWAEVLKSLESADTEFNIIYNPSDGNYTEDQLMQELGNIQGLRLVTLNIPEAMVFLQRQKLVLSNDTGFAHIATVVENGPEVISLHAYNNTPNAWVSNTQRQYGIWSGREDLDVNTIPTQTVIQRTKQTLNIQQDEAQQSAQPAAPDAAARTETQPEGFLDQVNRTLNESSSDTSRFEASPDDLVRYLTTLELPRGARIKSPQIRIENNQIKIGGAINAAGQDSEFDATLSISPTGELQLASRNIHPAFFHRPFIGDIEARLSDVNKELTGAINSRVDPSWEVSGFEISGDKIGLKFKKKAS